MHLQQLHYLISAADSGSINKAAKALHITHQGLSNSLIKLEQEFHCKLFNRSNQGINLTAKGVEVYYFAKAILIEYSKMQKNIFAIQQKNLTGSINIQSTNSVSLTIIPRLFTKFFLLYPNIALNITDNATENIISDLLNGRAEVGFLTLVQIGENYYPSLPANIQYTNLLTATTACWCSTISPLFPFNGKYVSLKKMLSQPLVFNSNYDKSLLEILMREQNIKEYKIVYETNNLNLLAQMVCDNLGVALDMCFESTNNLMMENFFSHKNVGIVYLDPKKAPKTSLGFITAKNRPMSKPVQHLLNFLSQNFEQIVK